MRYVNLILYVCDYAITFLYDNFETHHYSKIKKKLKLKRSLPTDSTYLYLLKKRMLHIYLEPYSIPWTFNLSFH